MSLASNLPLNVALSPEIRKLIETGGNVASFARSMAVKHGLVYVENDLDRFALDAARLADAQVQPDQTADILVTLYRAGVISNRENMALYDLHLRQTVR